MSMSGGARMVYFRQGTSRLRSELSGVHVIHWHQIHGRRLTMYSKRSWSFSKHRQYTILHYDGMKVCFSNRSNVIEARNAGTEFPVDKYAKILASRFEAKGVSSISSPVSDHLNSRESCRRYKTFRNDLVAVCLFQELDKQPCWYKSYLFTLSIHRS